MWGGCVCLCRRGFCVRAYEGGLFFVGTRWQSLSLSVGSWGILIFDGQGALGLKPLPAVVDCTVEKTCRGPKAEGPGLRLVEADFGGLDPLPSPSWGSLWPLQTAPVLIPTGTRFPGWEGSSPRSTRGSTSLGGKKLDPAVCGLNPRAALRSVGLSCVFWLLLYW